MSAGTFPIVIEQGATLDITLKYEDPDGAAIDLTGFTARAQMRQRAGVEAGMVDLNTTNGKITIDGPAGTLRLLIPDEETSALTWNRGVYDLFLYAPDGSAMKLLEGVVTVKFSVTR